MNINNHINFHSINDASYVKNSDFILGELTVESKSEQLTLIAQKSLRDLSSTSKDNFKTYNTTIVLGQDHFRIDHRELFSKIIKSKNPIQNLITITRHIEHNADFSYMFDKITSDYLQNFFDNFPNLTFQELENKTNELIALIKLKYSSKAEDALLSQVSEKLANLLINKNIDYGPLQTERPESAESPQIMKNQTERLTLAAKIRKSNADNFIGRKNLKIDDFSESNVPFIALVGNKVDPGIYYQNIGSSIVKGNEIQITRRKVNISTNKEFENNVERAQLRFELIPSERREMENGLNALSEKNSQLRELLSAEFGEITVSKKEVKYEISDTKLDASGIPQFNMSNVKMANMISIKIEGIGEVLIGDEATQLTEAEREALPNIYEEAPKKFHQANFVGHHTVLVRIEGGDIAIDEEKIKKFHLLLSAVGLSRTLIPASEDELKKRAILTCIEIYSPNLLFAVKMAPKYAEMSSEQLKQFYLELLPSSDDGSLQSGEFSREDVKLFINQELKDGIDKQTCLIGSSYIKLHHVGEQMAKKGALGFFAGVASNPSIVASVLKTGAIAAAPRSRLGFKFPSTCHQDAVTGGDSKVYVRLATKGMVKEIKEKSKRLDDCPYINTYQLITSLDVANIPHAQRNHNSYGIDNPMAELTAEKGGDPVSGSIVFETTDSIHFVEKQNKEPTMDNEVMLSIDALDASYIKKIMYRDGRKYLLNFLEKQESCPESLKQALKEKINQGEKIQGPLKAAIMEYLERNGLIEEKLNSWTNINEKRVKGLTEMPILFDELSLNPKEELKNVLIKEQLLDDNNQIFGVNFDEFVVDSEQFGDEIFK